MAASRKFLPLQILMAFRGRRASRCAVKSTAIYIDGLSAKPRVSVCNVIDFLSYFIFLSEKLMYAISRKLP